MTSLAIQDVGRICAVAGQCQRDLQRWVSRYPNAFHAGLFDPTTLTSVSFVHAVSSPRLSATVLRTVNRATIWAFALDRVVDEAASTERDIREVGRRCRAVASGDMPANGDALGAALADLRGELSQVPAYEWLAPIWRREVSRVLASMAREWRWRRAGHTPTVDDYLANADNLAFCFIFSSHLVVMAAVMTSADVARFMRAARAVQRTIRVINDLGTYRRDLATGDLNLLRLGVTRRAARRLLSTLIAESRRRIAPLRDTHADLARYLDHHIDFNLGFYPVTDYWGQARVPVADGA